jgi:N-acetylmuramoyl-L-alanine amidase
VFYIKNNKFIKADIIFLFVSAVILSTAVFCFSYIQKTNFASQYTLQEDYNTSKQVNSLQEDSNTSKRDSALQEDSDVLKTDSIKKLTQKKENCLICIDPGHQERGDSSLEQVAPNSSQKKAKVSSGTTGIATKKPEYVLNLEASQVLKKILEEKKYEVMMTRETHEVNISNSQRAIMANEAKADLVVRIHADGLDNPSVTGSSVLVPAKDGQYTSAIYEESYKVAQIIKKNFQNENIKINGIFERNDLTGFNWSTVPTVLIEMGFMSNYNEDLMMSDKSYQEKMMNAVADAIDEAFEE